MSPIKHELACQMRKQRTSSTSSRKSGEPRLHAGAWKRGGIPPLWNRQAGRRIVEVVERVFMAQ
jgi:hypothetical protein